MNHLRALFSAPTTIASSQPPLRPEPEKPADGAPRVTGGFSGRAGANLKALARRLAPMTAAAVAVGATADIRLASAAAAGVTVPDAADAGGHHLREHAMDTVDTPQLPQSHQQSRLAGGEGPGAILYSNGSPHVAAFGEGHLGWHQAEAAPHPSDVEAATSLYLGRTQGSSSSSSSAAGATKRSAGAARRQRGVDQGILPELVRRLCGKGIIHKLFVTELHEQPGTDESLAAVVRGVRDSGRFATLYREMNVPAEMEADGLGWEIDVAMANPKERYIGLGYVMQEVLGHAKFDEPVWSPAARQLEADLNQTSQFDLRRLSLTHPTARYISDFIKANSSVTIASTGVAHATGTLLRKRKNTVQSPGGRPWYIPLSGQLSPPLSGKTQRDNYNAFLRALKKERGTLMVVPSSVFTLWLPMVRLDRQEFHQYYRDRSLVVMEVPVPVEADPGFNVTLVGSLDALPEMQQFAKEHGASISLLCAGLPGCEGDRVPSGGRPGSSRGEL